MTDQTLRAQPALRIAPWLLLALLALSSACTTLDYYGQAMGGQLSLLAKRQPIDQLLDDGALAPATARQLQAVNEIRRFARDTLGLDVGRAYASYVETGQRAIVWNVFAAPGDSVEARTWCYPLIGCASYRGYFSESDARAYAQKLSARGYDTWVGGVRAYSTLGWFADPVLDTFLHDDETALAALLFHELAHRLFYVRGDTQFNESFATSIEHYAVGLWLAGRVDSQQRERALAIRQQRLADELAFVELISQHREQLAHFYQHAAPDALAAGKASRLQDLAQAIEQFAQSSPSRQHYRQWGSQLNNARLAPVQSYYGDLPAMNARLAYWSAQRCPASPGPAHCVAAMSAYIEEMKALARRPKTERDAAMASWIRE